ncbi:MAG: YibE/F family protein [Desulfovibrionaceae bacterium]
MTHPLFRNADVLLSLTFLLLCSVLWFVPTGFESRVDSRAVQCKAEILDTDDVDIQRLGLVLAGEQSVRLRVLDGPFAGREFQGVNPLLGQMDRDKIFQPGDTALVVLTLEENGEVLYVNPQEHYRIGLELLLLGMFAGLLLLFGGWTGAKALLSFVFAGLMIWKVLVPLLLLGADPIRLSLGVVALLCGAIIFLVAGLTRKGLAAFLGAFLGVLTSCFLAVLFTDAFHVHGALLPFASTLLYSGYAHLDLTGIFVAAVFLASSGAVMDLAMDVAASMDEVVSKKPDISRFEAFVSGVRVGRAVVGTMTTTLLLAYSGGYVTLLMAFMAQGVPLTNTFNLVYVAAEILKTLVGSFGLVLVAPFTALAGALLLTRGKNTNRPRP